MKNLPDVYELFQKQAERLLTPSSGDPEIIPAHIQEEKLRLKKSTPFETFFFVINNRLFQTDNVQGVCNLLGYPDKTFTLKKFFSLVHPAHSIILSTSRYELLETLMKGERSIQFSSPLLIANIAIKHLSGEYLLFKWLASPFQISSGDAMVSCLNEFTLISPFHHEICNMRFVNEYGKTVEWYHELAFNIKKRFKAQAFFSEKEMLILTHYSLNASCTNATVASWFDIKVSSVITYNKRILKKATKFFMRQFKTAHGVADYLHQEKLI